MIAQALAVMHPAQVRRLILCATNPGNGQAVVPPVAARQPSSDAPPNQATDFPANQAGAFNAFKAAIAEYPPAPAVSPGTKGDQAAAISDWWAGNDAARHQVARIPVPTLIADGTDDQEVPLGQ